MNMRYVSAWVAALVCAALGSSSLIASIAQGGTVDVTLTIDFNVRQIPISPTMVGVSVSADGQGNGLATGGVAAAAIASTAQLRAKMIRFPDDISQSYRWSGAASQGALTTADFHTLAHEAQISNIMITVNMVSGTPDEAAKWVAMANQPTGSTNASQGRPGENPYDIGYWMLGEDITAHLDKFPTAQSYATAALENASKMRAAFPAIKIGLWIADGTTTAGADYNTALLTSIKLFDPYQNGTVGARLIDFLAVAVDVPVPNRPLSDAALYPSLYAYAATRADQVVSSAEAASTVLIHELPIAVYRYGINFGPDGWNHEKSDSLGVANALSGMVNAFARHEKVFTAIYAGLNRHGFDALLQVPDVYDVSAGQRFALNPFGNVLASYGQLLLGATLSSELQGTGASAGKAFYQAPQVGGTMPGAEHVPILSAEAAYDNGGDQMVLFLSSRSLSDRVVVHVVLAHTLPATVDPHIVTHTIQSPSLSTDGYTGVTQLEARSEVPLFPIATASNGDLSVDFTLERNAVALFTFSVTTS